MTLTVSTARTPPAHTARAAVNDAARFANGGAAWQAPAPRATYGANAKTSVTATSSARNTNAWPRSAETLNDGAHSINVEHARANAAQASAATSETLHGQSSRAQAAHSVESGNALGNTARHLRKNAASFTRRHPKTVAYGAAGLVAAALILLIGFWPTLLIALLAGIGVAIGSYRDGDATVQRFAARAAHRLKR